VRKFLYTLGAITLLIIVVASIGMGALVYRGNALDAESKAFVDSAVTTLATSWSNEQLLERATPELRASVKPEQLKSVADAFSRLGPLLKYQGATGQANMSYIAGSGSSVSASYVATTGFRDGTATMWPFAGPTPDEYLLPEEEE